MSNLLQERIIDLLISKLGSKKAVLEHFLSEFNISKSAAYNRLNGDTLLNADEIVSLAQGFDFSIDHLIGVHPDQITFRLPSLLRTPKSLDEFFGGVRSFFKYLLAQENCQVQYVTYEIPLFQYFFSPELTAFKVFIWARSIWNWDYVQQEQFSIEKCIRLFDLPGVTKELLDNYLSITTTEFWNTNILDNTINQLKYYREAGAIQSKEDLRALYTALVDLIDHAELMAARGVKFKPGAFQKDNNFAPIHLYFNQFIYTNNTILASSKEVNAVFATFDNPNFMQSDDPKIIAYTEQWFEDLKKRSTRISVESERERTLFFNILREKVARAREASFID